MARIENIEEANIKLSPGKKIGYAIGDFGNNFSWSFISSFLLYFWTDCMGIGAGIAGTIMGVSRIWDAINDPIIGRASDMTKSKHGRYRPWIIWFTIPLAVCNVLCFTNWGFTSDTVKVVYAFVTFFTLVLLYTCVNVPYSAMEASVTLDAKERGSLATYRLFFAYMAATIIGYGSQYFIGAFGGENASKGYMLTAIMYSCIMVVAHIICFKNTHEVVMVAHEKVSVKENFKALKGNVPVIILSAGFLVYGLFYYGRSAVTLYYFTYNGNNALAYATYSLINLVFSVVGIVCLGTFSKKLKNKATVPMIGFLVVGIVTIAHYWLDPSTPGGLTIIYVLTAVIGFFMGMTTTMIYGMVPDTTEYTQLKYGIRASGFISAFVNFFLKVGMAIGTTGVGLIMAATGFIANQAQNAATLNGINIMFSLLPGILSIVTAILMKFYPIDQKTYDDILVQLQAKEEAEHKEA
jgi:GPH family glycoside/pentoside/hexuronide:cation symporter